MYTDTITHIASGAVASLSFEVSGLAEKGQYTFNLRARNARGWSPPGQMSTLITMPSCGALKPQPPAKPTLVQIGSCSIGLRWALVSGRATGGAPILAYEARAWPTGVAHESRKIVATDVGAEMGVTLSEATISRDCSSCTEATISGLQASTSYNLAVRVRNVLGWSELSETVVGRTPAASDDQKPSQPMPPRLLDPQNAPAAAPSDAPAVTPSAKGTAPSPSALDAALDARIAELLDACDVVGMWMPGLRGGCDQDDHFTLEWRVGGSWQPVPPVAMLMEAPADRGGGGSGSGTGGGGSGAGGGGSGTGGGGTGGGGSGGGGGGTGTGGGGSGAGGGGSGAGGGGGAALPLRSRVVGVRVGDAYKASTFRVIAHNAAGASLPSSSTEPLLPRTHSGAWTTPPAVVATSSASFLVTWVDESKCRPELTWTVTVYGAAKAAVSGGPPTGMGHAVALGGPARVAAIDETDTVLNGAPNSDDDARDDIQGRVLSRGAKGASFAANSIRCPSACRFSVTPNLDEFGGHDGGGGSGTTVRQATPPRAVPVLSVPTAPLALLDPFLGTIRLELELARDFGSEDLLIVQQELLAQLAAVVHAPAERLLIAQAYAAGKFFVVDVLPSTGSKAARGGEGGGGGGGGGGGDASADELVQKLVQEASDVASPLFDQRVLGRLNGLKRIDGYGSALTEVVLLADVQSTGLGYAKTSIADVLKLVVFAGGVLLACGLCASILYGTCRVDGSQHPQIEDLQKAHKATKDKARQQREQASAEEKQSLAMAVDTDEAFFAALGPSLTAPNMAPMRSSRSCSSRSTRVELD
jgi:hypothetical protein